MKTQTKAVSRISELENQISFIQEEIIAHEAEIKEFEETLQMLESHPGWMPEKSGSIFESLKLLIESEPEAEMRSQRIRQSKLALDQAAQAVRQKKNTASMLTALLIAEQDEELWQQRYAPYIQQYENGFQQDPDPRLLKIQQLEKDIAQFRPQLAVASEWVRSPDYAKPKYFYSRDPKGDAEYLPSAIEAREKMLENLRSQPSPPRDEKKFRSYIQERVELEPSLQKLLEAQELYAQALGAFKHAAAKCEIALGFCPEELTEPVQVVVKNNQISLGGKHG